PEDEEDQQQADDATRNTDPAEATAAPVCISAATEQQQEQNDDNDQRQRIHSTLLTTCVANSLTSAYSMPLLYRCRLWHRRDMSGQCCAVVALPAHRMPPASATCCPLRRELVRHRQDRRIEGERRVGAA